MRIDLSIEAFSAQVVARCAGEVVEFEQLQSGQRVAWFDMTPEEARGLALVLMLEADRADAAINARPSGVLLSVVR